MPLGSITVDGVSLTVNAIPAPGVIQISLIPFTLQHTTLGERQAGDRVHLEADTIGKYVAELASRPRRSGSVMTTFGTIEQAIDDLRNGKIVIVADDEDRENEGDLVCAAELATPEMINFMTLHGRGLICLALTGERCDQLGLPQMTERNTEELSHRLHREHRRRAALRRHHRHLRQRPRHHDPRRHQSRHRAVRSPAARATSSRCAPAPAACCSASARPRPAWTSRGSPGSSRRRHLRDPQRRRLDGAASRAAERSREQHRLTFVTVAQLVAYRLQTEQLVHRVAEARLPTDFGEFTHHRLPERRGPRGARGAGVRRGGGPAGRPRAHALEVPHGRRVRLAALRLRLAAPPRHGDDRRARAAA